MAVLALAVLKTRLGGVLSNLFSGRHSFKVPSSQTLLSLDYHLEYKSYENWNSRGTTTIFFLFQKFNLEVKRTQPFRGSVSGWGDVGEKRLQKQTGEGKKGKPSLENS